MKKKILAVLLAALTLVVPFTASAKEYEKDTAVRAGSLNLNSETKSQPFPKNAGGSEKFRIPAFMVLNDGSLFAAADARYSTTGDGGGLDTIIARSKDNGQTWKQDYAIWYPDSEGFADLISTTCIDPAVVQGKDGTIYVVADMNPSGVTTKPEYIPPNIGTGFMTVEGKERLALTDDYKKVNENPKEKSYPYYLGDMTDGYAKVMNAKDNTPTKWALDQWYNIYELSENSEYKPIYQNQVNSSKKVQQNVFYKDSVLHVYNTGYMLMASSKDNGESWSAQILNPQIKRATEKALLVSPGKGTLTSDGTILIPFYTFERNEDKIIQQASFIWSKDNGQSWHRSEDAPNANGVEWSSESEVIEVYNGVLRMFIRNGTDKIAYIDAKWDKALNDYVWENPVVTDVEVWSGCNLTAITYSKKIDGKMAVMVGCPSGNKRTSGKIFTFLVNEDNTMTPSYAYRINVGDFAYSCMDELHDGSVGILYEARPGTMKYKNITVEELTCHDMNFEHNVIITCAIAVSAVVVAACASIAYIVYKNKK